MKNRDIDEQLMRYLSAELSGRELEELEKLLLDRNFDPEELREMKVLYRDLGRLPVPRPGKAMTRGFYRMLETFRLEQAARQRRKEAWLRWLGGGVPRHVLIQTAAAVFLLFAGWSAGRWLTPKSDTAGDLAYMSSELREMKKMMMFSLLNQSSPTERMKAVHYLKGMVGEDDQVLHALLETLDQDPNINVRMVALEALAPFSHRERIRSHLIYSLDRQTSPLVQLTLVDLVLTSGGEEAVEPMKQLLKRGDLNFMVRDRILSGLNHITAAG
jgi:hypothetical protein